MKYLVVPQWLVRSLQENGLSLESLLDGEKLCAILSQTELSFYVEANSTKWGGRLRRSSDVSLMKRFDEHGLNAFWTMDDIETKVFTREMTLRGNRTLTELVMGPCFMHESAVDLHMLCLKPVLIGRDVVGLIPMCADTSKDPIVRRDLYRVMHHFMSSEEIIRSPIFGV